MSFASVFIVVVIIVAVAFLAMAVGVLLGRRPIRGSCGGLGNSDSGSSCSMCSNRNNCDEASVTDGAEEPCETQR